MNPSIWTINQIMKSSTEYLSAKGITNNKLDVEILLADALGLSRIELYTNFDKPVALKERDMFRKMLQECGTGKPVAYILNSKGFMDFDFYVDNRVLIPRNDTEILCEHSLQFIKKYSQSNSKITILDVGCGSGCLAISLAIMAKKYCATVEVTAWEKSLDAICVAKVNKDKLEATNLQIIAQDACEISEVEQTFDLIVSNPPYVKDGDSETLDDNVRLFEPELALYGGEDGLKFYKMMAQNYSKLLNKDGVIMLEVGFDQACSVESIFTKYKWQDIATYKDYAKITRVISARPPIL